MIKLDNGEERDHGSKLEMIRVSCASLSLHVMLSETAAIAVGSAVQVDQRHVGTCGEEVYRTVVSQLSRVHCGLVQYQLYLRAIAT
mgnify:CR=1 FL=1|jgi:hypothetical protein